MTVKKKKFKDPFAGMDIPWESLDEYEHPERIMENYREALKEYPRHADISDL